MSEVRYFSLFPPLSEIVPLGRGSVPPHRIALPWHWPDTAGHRRAAGQDVVPGALPAILSRAQAAPVHQPHLG